MKNNIANAFPWVVWFSVLFISVKILCIVWVSPLMWGMNFGSFLPHPAMMIYALISIGLILFVRFRYIERLVKTCISFMELHPLKFLGISVTIFVVLAHVFRVKAPLLGDSFVLINNFEYTFKGGHELNIIREPLAIAYFYLMMAISGWTSYPEITSAFFYGEILLGIVFTIILFAIVREITPLTDRRFLLFVFLLLLPSTELFFGYVEVYSVVLCVASLFIFMVLRYLNKKSSIIAVSLSYYLLICTHIVAVIILPAFLYLLWVEVKRRKWIPAILSVVTGVVGLIVLFSMGHPLLQRVFPPDGHTHYLSFFDVNDGYQAYSLLSFFHSTELLNLILLVSPFLLFMLIWILVVDRTKVVKTAMVNFFLLMTAGVLCFIFVAKFDLAISKDWDVSAPWLFMVQLFLAYLFLQAEGSDRVRSFILLSLVTVAHSFLWFGLNSTIEPNLNRVSSMRDTRVYSREAYFLSTMHLTKYLDVSGNYDDPVRYWEEYIDRFPASVKGLSNLTTAYAKNHNDNWLKIERTILRWRELAPSDSEARQTYLTFCFDYAQHLERSGHSENAEGYYKTMISIDSSDAKTYNNLGTLYASHGKTGDAINMFMKSAQVDSNYLFAYMNIGKYYIQTGNVVKGIGYFNRVISKDSSFIDAYRNLMIAYRMEGESDKAQEIKRLGMEMERRLSQNGNR